jgi:toxin ParE1/3/4
VARVFHTIRARRDLIDIWLEVSVDNPAAADALYDRLEARVRLLGRFPKAGPRRPNVAPEARVLIEPPYLILYRLRRDAVQIVRVVHSARNIDRALFSEGFE